MTHAVHKARGSQRRRGAEGLLSPALGIQGCVGNQCCFTWLLWGMKRARGLCIAALLLPGFTDSFEGWRVGKLLG